MKKNNVINTLTKCTTKANAKNFADYQGHEICYMVTMKNSQIVKVGQTNDLMKRMKMYITHNPMIRLLDIVEGDRTSEDLIHDRMKELGYKQIDRSEWFELPTNINKNTLKKGFTILAG